MTSSNQEAVERVKADLELQDGGGIAYTCQDALYTVVVQGEDLRSLLSHLQALEAENTRLNGAVTNLRATQGEELARIGVAREIERAELEAQRDSYRKALEEIAVHPGPHADEAAHWRAEAARQALSHSTPTGSKTGEGTAK